MKSGLALILAAVLAIPTLPARAEEAASADASPMAGVSETSAEEVIFNTGNGNVTVADGSVSGNDAADVYFESDGSYTIPTGLVGLNAFFPYEVQFTCNGETTKEWFLTPDDSVEVGGHTFYVEAVADGSAVTQISLEVGGDTVAVYPEEKEFADQKLDMASPLTLLPIKEVRLGSVDLTSYTPVELTQVSVKALLGDKVADGDTIAWRNRYTDGDYEVSQAGDKVNLSVNTYYGSSQELEMIVGSGNQLDADAVRYLMSLRIKESRKWLLPAIYMQDGQGIRTALPTVESSTRYSDYRAEREMAVCAGSSTVGTVTEAYVSLKVNPDVFPGSYQLRAFEGNYTSAEEAMAAAEITDRIFCTDMTQANAGYLLPRHTSGTPDKWITVVSFDGSGNVTGCLSFLLELRTSGISMYPEYALRYKTESGTMSPDVTRGRSTSYNSEENCNYYTYTLASGNAADKVYYQRFLFSVDGTSSPDSITGAYVGLYDSIAEAAAAGAADIKGDLFGTSGYGADYSQGVCFTIFYGADGAPDQRVWRYGIKTVEASVPSTPTPLNSGVQLFINGFQKEDKTSVNYYQVRQSEDSYGEYNFLTFIVDKDVTDEELKNLAPVFTVSAGAKLYTAGGSAEEISGESYHDFTSPVLYTVSAENGENAKNYWIQVLRATEGAGQLFINSLVDPNAETHVGEDGVIYSTREVMLDSYHDDIHDILLANMGTEAIEKLSVELESDTVELHGYWTLDGQEDMLGFVDLMGYQPAGDGSISGAGGSHGSYASYGELWNLAKVRLIAKEGVAAGTDVNGTLTIKSGDKVLIVLTLTGTVGDPTIITQEIPETVLYVPYGTMIQNSNKYSWNKVSYTLESGTLPSGMVVKPNGEIYGVPREMGEFTLTVRMDNSYAGFDSSSKTYTLVINENTDANVDAATDTGYELSQRVQNIDMGSFTSGPSPSQMLVSQGVLDEFVDIYLDGVKLTEGQDYEAESGSTRITIRSITLASAGEGAHTLGMEFRTGSDILKRAAQNYQVSPRGQEPGVDNNDGSHGNGGDNDDEENVTQTGATVGETMAYTVVKGDNLSKIARRIGVSLAQLLSWNPQIKNPNLIFPGQVLIVGYRQGSAVAEALNLEGAAYYEVKKGDCLYRIAGRNGLSLNALVAMNPEIAKQKYIYPGQKIRIK